MAPRSICTPRPATYAPVVLLPGDPNRATRMAARFDGGLEATPARQRQPRPARLHRHPRRGAGLGPDHDDGHADDDDRGRGAHQPRRARRSSASGRAAASRARQTGDVVVALAAAASLSGIGHDPGRRRADGADRRHRGRPRARRGEPGGRPDHPRRADRDLRRLLRPAPGAASIRWGARGYLAAEMESAAVFLLAMRERGKGRHVRAGTILTVSDVIRDPDDPDTADARRRGLVPPARGRAHRPDRPDDRRRLTAAEALGRRLTRPQRGAPQPTNDRPSSKSASRSSMSSQPTDSRMSPPRFGCG